MADEFLPSRILNPTLLATIPRDHTMADTMYNRLVAAIREFEDGLDAEEEIGAQLAQFGQTVTVAVEDVSYHNPHLIKLHGVTPDGHRCTLLQHMSQVNILLVALKVKDQREPRRIGFRLADRGDNESEK